MTVLEALEQSISTLNAVNIPVSMIQQVGVPIQQAVAMIQASVYALEQNALQPPEEERDAAETDEHETVPEESASAEEDLFGETELAENEKAGGEHDEHADV